MEHEAAATCLAAHVDYRVLRRVAIADKHIFVENAAAEPVGRLAVIDTETTGFKVDEGDRIIDLAIAVCEYGRETGTLYRVVDRYESLEDPETPISAEITKLTGITDEMVSGQRIVEAGVAQVMDGVGLVVCHNARFDRAFLEARLPSFVNRHFGCSHKELPWSEWGIGSSKLDYLGVKFGLFHEGHRARADVDMLIAILSQRVPGGDLGVLSVLLESARTPSWRVHAIGLDIASKDIARARGYHWNDGKFSTPKAWWLESGDEQVEREFLAGLGCKNPRLIRQTARERYRSLAALVEAESERDAAVPSRYGSAVTMPNK